MEHVILLGIILCMLIFQGLSDYYTHRTGKLQHLYKALVLIGAFSMLILPLSYLTIMSAYLLIRIGLFPLIMNHFLGQTGAFLGTTSMYDKIMKVVIKGLSYPITFFIKSEIKKNFIRNGLLISIYIASVTLGLAVTLSDNIDFYLTDLELQINLF